MDMGMNMTEEQSLGIDTGKLGAGQPIGIIKTESGQHPEKGAQGVGASEAESGQQLDDMGMDRQGARQLMEKVM